MVEDANNNRKISVQERHKSIRFTVGCICGLLAVAIVCYTIIRVTVAPPWIQALSIIAGIPTSMILLFSAYRRWQITIGNKIKVEVDGYLADEMNKNDRAE